MRDAAGLEVEMYNGGAYYLQEDLISILSMECREGTSYVFPNTVREHNIMVAGYQHTLVKHIARGYPSALLARQRGTQCPEDANRITHEGVPASRRLRTVTAS